MALPGRPACALFDLHLTGHLCSLFSPIITGSLNCYIGVRPAVRMFDISGPHLILVPKGKAFLCIPHAAAIYTGSLNIMIGFRPAAKMFDLVDFGAMVTGTPNVWYGFI